MELETTPPTPICPICTGTGFEISETEAGSRAQPCRCRRTGRSDRLRNAARIPLRYRHCTLNNYDRMNRSQERARAIAEKYVREYPNPEIGLLFIGPCGVGKTHLAVAILQGLVATKGVAGLFYDYRDLLKEIQATFGAGPAQSEMGVLRPVFRTELLVLDDIGARQPTAWVDEVLSHIINQRYNEKRITLLTSNYLDQAAEESGPTLEDRIGSRLRSRLYEMCKEVLIEGDDFRKNRKARDRF